MTEPDEGTTGHRSLRWSGPQVTYRVGAGYPAGYLATIRSAFAFAADHTGLTVTETDGAADIEVVALPGGNAHTTLWPHRDGSLDRVVVELGCCRDRAAWEDILQAFGPAGDRGPVGTLFSNDLTATTPGPFEACVLRALYDRPPGSPAVAFAGIECP